MQIKGQLQPHPDLQAAASTRLSVLHQCTDRQAYATPASCAKQQGPVFLGYYYLTRISLAGESVAREVIPC